MEIAELLKGIATANEIESKLFDVVKLQLHPNIEGFISPNNYGLYKGTGGNALGVVGDAYEPTQPKLLFNGLLECIAESDFNFNQMQYTEHKGGKVVRFSVPVGKVSFKNFVGADDESIVTLNVQTGFDGYTKTSMYLSTMRLICTNGMKISQTEFSIAYKNTKGNIGRPLAMAENVRQALSQQLEIQELMEHLDKVQVKQKEIDDFIFKVTGYNQSEYNEANARKRKTMDLINESVALEFQRTGTTAFGLLNGITHYTNHVINTKNREDFIYVDGGREMNDRALKYALELN